MGSVEPRDEICRQSQAACTPFHANGGASQALCTSMMKLADRLGLGAPPQKKGGLPEALRPPTMKIADSLRLCAPLA